MRSSFFRTLLYLLPVFLLLNCSPQAQSVETESAAKAESQRTEVPAADTVGIPSPPHLELALSYEGTTELTGNNDGPEVERFLDAVGLPAGNPYCAAFVSFVLDETDHIDKPQIRSALAYHFITDLSVEARKVVRGTEQIPPGTITIWRKGNTIYGHAALVDKQKSNFEFVTIEANTSAGTYGSQANGDGVYRRDRQIQPGNYFRITHFTRVSYA